MYHCPDGDAKLIFPEYFEEAVENTPARILVTKTHGSGMWYRNCIVKNELQFDQYDKRFAWAVENEQEEVVVGTCICTTFVSVPACGGCKGTV